MKDLCIIQQANPRLLVTIGQSLGNAGVNIEGLSLSSIEEQTVVHLLANDERTAVTALQQANVPIEAISEVFILDKDYQQVTGKPGSFGSICQLLEQHGLVIKFGYPAENNRFVFGLDNIIQAKKLLA